jgi:hypothetical protein
MRYLGLLLPVLLTGCPAPVRPVHDPKAVANLQAQAAEVERAMLREDHGRMADLSHPALVSYCGGRAGYIRKLQEEAGDLRGQGLRFHAFRFGEPSRLFESGGELYAVYPYALELTGPDGGRASQPSYFVGVSADRGATWRFLDGAGAGSDRGKLRRWLPRFPDELPLPEPQPLLVH